MKKLSLVLLICITGYFSNAQEVSFRSNREKQLYRPKMFVRESARTSVRQNFINEMLNLKTNQQVIIQVTDNTKFKGKVTSITNDAPGLQTYILQSSEVPGLVLSISKIEINGAPASYRGVMISKDHSDLMILEKDTQTGKYMWNKQEVANVIPD